MDKIILGLLMLRRFTIYEMRSVIRKNFQSMCSDSLGGIQSAVKKLLAAQMIAYSECVERGINKKRYSITDKGRRTLSQWLRVPADLSNSKNMEIGKLLFMGLVPAGERLQLIDGMIVRLKEELAFLLGVLGAADLSGGKGEAVEYWTGDREYYRGIRKATRNPSMEENADAIGYFEIAALRYGIDSVKFNIAWLERQREHITKQKTGR